LTDLEDRPAWTSLLYPSLPYYRASLPHGREFPS